MFPGTKYFSSISCPFFASGLCERPYCHFRHRIQHEPLSGSSNPKESSTQIEELVQNAVQRALYSGPTTSATETMTATKDRESGKEKSRKLFLPPKDVPVYKPTPKHVLEPPSSAYIPTGLSQLSTLSYRPSIRKPPPPSSSSAVPIFTKKEDVLGDIGDLSESDDDDKNPNVIGSILVQGVKSGVLGGDVNEFDHEVIKNKYKIKEKKTDNSKTSDDVVKIDDHRITKEVEETVQEEKEPKTKIEMDKKEEEKEAEEEEKNQKLKERLEAKRKLEEKEQELKKLEEKRKILANFYKVEKNEETIQKKDEDRRSNRKKKKRSSGSSSRHRSSSSSHNKKTRKKSSSSSKKSKKRKHSESVTESSSSSSDSYDSSSSSSSYSSSTSSYSSSSSYSSEDEDERKKRHRKRRHHKKRKKKYSTSKKKRHSSSSDKKKRDRKKRNKNEDRKGVEEKKEDRKDKDKRKDKKDKEEKKKLEEKKVIKTDKVDKKDEDAENIDDEDLPESVKSFLDAMSEIDRKNQEMDKKAVESSSSSLSKPEEKEEVEVEEEKEEEFDTIPDNDDDEYFAEDDLENEDDELRRIFEEHEATFQAPSTSTAHKRKNTDLISENEETEPKTKKRTAHKSDAVHESTRPPTLRKPMSATQQMLNRFQKIQNMRQTAEIESQLASLEQSESGGKQRIAHNPSSSQNPPMTKLQRQLQARREATESNPGQRTVAHTIKGLSRVSHTPTVNVSKPLIAPDFSGKVPSSIRQRYLNTIVEECLKIYGGDTSKAYPRATREEQNCCDRSKNRNIYLNVIVNCIKKLRTEAASADSVPSVKRNNPKSQRSMLTTHMQVLAGKAGSIGSWSIEKSEDVGEASPALAYAILKRYVMSEEDLKENGYPIEDPEVKGRALIQEGHYNTKQPQPADPNERRCDRCNAIYKVDRSGKQIESAECIYHWGRLYRQRSNRALGPVSGYYCCNGDSGSDGCEIGRCHVTDTFDYNNIRGFVTALERSSEPEDGDHGVYALDCEMCYTTAGTELTRVTVIDLNGKTVYETMVKPEKDIIDYNTRFSGITKDDLRDVDTTLRDVQAVLLSMCSSKTILIGHSLESDLKALRMIHKMVVDTSIIYPHKMGPPYKRALKQLAAEHLKRIIQNEVGGHDSAEDALAALDLMKIKIKSDLKKLKQESLKNK